MCFGVREVKCFWPVEGTGEYNVKLEKSQDSNRRPTQYEAVGAVTTSLRCTDC